MGVAVSPEPDLTSFPPTGLTRCLVVGRVADLPPAWVERIRAGRGSVEALPHPLVAFAEALRHEVADRLRPSFGLARQESIAVVFAGGEFRDELESFAAAIRAHAPAVGVWTVDDGAARPVLAEPRPGPDPSRPPSLRLAGTGPASIRPEPAAPTAATPPEAPAEPRTPLDASVTPEEIEMLLSYFDADPDASPDGPTGGGR